MLLAILFLVVAIGTLGMALAYLTALTMHPPATARPPAASRRPRHAAIGPAPQPQSSIGRSGA
jgi:hypothetical protein